MSPRCDHPGCHEPIAYVCYCRRCHSEEDDSKFWSCLEHPLSPEIRKKHDQIYPACVLSLTACPPPKEPMTSSHTDEQYAQLAREHQALSARLEAVRRLVAPESSSALPWPELWKRLVEMHGRAAELGPGGAMPADPNAPPLEAFEEEGGVVRLVTRKDRDVQNCASVLRDLHQRALAGEYREFAFAATSSKSDADGHLVWTRSTSQQRLIGQVVLLQERLVRQIYGGGGT